MYLSGIQRIQITYLLFFHYLKKKIKNEGNNLFTSDGMKLILLHDTVRKHITSSLVQSTEGEAASIHEKENSCQFFFAGIHSIFFFLC